MKRERFSALQNDSKTDVQLWTRCCEGNGISPGWFSWGHPAGLLRFAPDAFSWRPNREDVVVVSRNASGVNELWRKAYKNGAWLDWQNLGSPPTSVASRPGSAAWGPNRFDIFFLSTESPPHVRHAYSNDDGAHVYWDDWGYPAGVTLDLSGVDAASWGDQSVDVVAHGGDGNIWQRAWDHGTFFGWFSWGNPGSPVQYSPSSVGLGDGRLDVTTSTISTGGYNVQVWVRRWDSGLSVWGDDAQYENSLVDISS